MAFLKTELRSSVNLLHNDDVSNSWYENSGRSFIGGMDNNQRGQFYHYFFPYMSEVKVYYPTELGSLLPSSVTISFSFQVTPSDLIFF